MNDRIVGILQANPDQFYSGQQLSSQLQCSRTAIWKHIESLREQGYQIEAIPRRGYKLVKRPEKLNLLKLVSSIRTERLGKDIRYYDSLDSTQTKAQELVKLGVSEGVMVIAEQQTAGRGRMGRAWHSPSGKGIWMSLVLTPRIPLLFAPQLTLLIAVALCRAIRMLTQLDVGIKWPNDLLVEGKKISGILLESIAEDDRLLHVIAGVGISVNLSIEDFPEELRLKAASLKMFMKHEVDREACIALFMGQLEQLYDLYHQQGFSTIQTMWEALNVTLHRAVQVKTASGTIEGIAESIDEYGALIVKLADGNRTKLYSGEIIV